MYTLQSNVESPLILHQQCFRIARKQFQMSRKTVETRRNENMAVTNTFKVQECFSESWRRWKNMTRTCWKPKSSFQRSFMYTTGFSIRAFYGLLLFLTMKPESKTKLWNLPPRNGGLIIFPLLWNIIGPIQDAFYYRKREKGSYWILVYRRKTKVLWVRNLQK